MKDIFPYEKPELKEIDLLIEEDVAKGVGSEFAPEPQPGEGPGQGGYLPPDGG